MISISLRAHFDAAHQLDLPYDSPCNRPHGHRYEVEVTASAEQLERGMVIDYNVLKSAIDEFDHRDLNALPHFCDAKLPTTAENIAHVLARVLQAKVGSRVSIDEVTVRETADTAARWRKPD
jgi:6-pyruvoyltetrahydropterin/6-carboxytetrahydropterin synthase